MNEHQPCADEMARLTRERDDARASESVLRRSLQSLVAQDTVVHVATKESIDLAMSALAGEIRPRAAPRDVLVETLQKIEDDCNDALGGHASADRMLRTIRIRAQAAITEARP